MTSDQSTPDLPDPSTFFEHKKGFKPIAPDTLVRITERSVSRDTDINTDAARPGTTYVVEGFAFGPDGDDPDARAYYLLDIPDHSFGGNFWAYPEHVQIYETVEHQAAARQEARTSLTAAALVREIVSSATSLSDLGIDAADWSTADGTATISGRTPEGVEFSAVVTVSDVEVGF